MIDRVRLRNFQIHKKLDIEFDEKITSIRGSNDSGKSSIIRAIYWVFYNQPTGDWMCRIDEDGKVEDASVKIIFKDGTIVKRIKGEKINKYIVDNEVYENFGFGVPEPVQEKLKIFKFVTNKFEFPIHVGMQDELPFLIHESSTAKSSILDKLTGMSILQKGITQFGKESLAITKEIKRVELEIEKDSEKLKEIPDIDNIQNSLDNIKSLEEQKENLILEVEKLKRIEQSLEKVNKIIENNQDIPKFTELLILVEDRKKLLEKLEKLEKLENDLRSCKKDLDLYIPSLDLEKINDLIDELENKHVEIKKFKDMYEKLKIVDNTILMEYSHLESLEKQEKKFYKENPLCPLCGGKWNG